MFIFKEVETDDERDQMHRLRYEIYCEKFKWVDAAICSDGKETDKYDKHSAHFVCILDAKAVGCSRLIKNSPLGWPIEAFKIHAAEVERDRIAELSRFAMDDALKESKFLVMLGLGRVMYQYCKESNITHIYGASDADFFVNNLGKLGFPFNKIGEPQMYMESESIPHMLVVEDMEDYLQKNSPQVFQYFKGEIDNLV